MPRDSDVETSVERADPLVGTIFDKRFRVDERIAVGGFGAIYRATHIKSGHRVALKVLLPSLAQDLAIVARFRREGDTLTALRSPHTINAYELGQASDRTLFIVMELLYGESLFERYKANGPFEWKRIAKIARQVCESLEEAHGKGIVHRDLKPTNIHLEKHDEDIDYVKVLDFGIAKIIGGGDFAAADITNAGQMIGTLDYMSPEQMVGGKVTGQTDIYTLGIVMYEMIAGCTPFPEAMTAAQALAAVMKTKPDPLYLRAPVPEEMDRIVMRCLERDLAKRYQTVTELRLDIARLLAGIAPDRSHAIETKPIVKHDELTQFTPPPQRLLDELRRSPDFEATQFTPPPAALLDELRTPPSWRNDDEYASTLARRAKRSTERDSEHDRVTQVARVADIVAAQAREQEQVTKVARIDDLVAAAEAHATDDNERPTNVARSAQFGSWLPPRSSASERAVTMPRDPAERAVTVTAARAGERVRAASDRMMTVPRGGDEPHDRDATQPRELHDGDRTLPRRAGEVDDRAMTAPRRRPSSREEDSSLDAATPPRVIRKPDSVPPPVPATARKPDTVPPPIPAAARRQDQPPVSAGARKPPSAPPPNVAAPRPGSRTAPPPSTLTPPRAVAIAGAAPAPSVPRTFTPGSRTHGGGTGSDSFAAQAGESGALHEIASLGRPLPPHGHTPVPSLVAAPFSPPPRIPTPVPSPMSAGMSSPLPPAMPHHAPPFAAPPSTSLQAPTYPLAANQRSTRGFDMGRMAAREATIRRLVWIVVLVVACGLGIVLATQL